MITFLFSLFIVFAIVNIAYYIGYLNFTSIPNTVTNNSDLPISVIICAKNEAENLKQFIPSILDQNYSNFEVVLINDASFDETLEVMESFLYDPRVKLVKVENNEAFWGKKKYALTLGIKKASNPYLLFTDADCAPESKFWIQKMASGFAQEKSIILGYGGYFKNKSSFLNKMIRFETLLTAVQYFSYANWGIPYMGVGRNLAYTSSEFYNQNGYATHLHLKSGDDDLFVNQAATKENTSICLDKDAITRSCPKTSYKSWITQKRRHISTAKYYKKKHKALLGLFYFSQFAFWILAIFLLSFLIHWQLVLGILVIRLILQFVVIWKSAKKLDELDLVWLTPILEIFLICIQFGIFSLNLFSKPTNWK